MPQYGPVGDFPVSGKIVGQFVRVKNNIRLLTRVAVVTGGGSGIGFAFAKLCHSKGAKVLLGDLKLTKEAEDYASKASSDVAFEKCDVTSWDDLHNLISASVKKFGAVPDIYAPIVCCSMIFKRALELTFNMLESMSLAGAISGTMRRQGLIRLFASTSIIQSSSLD